ncbi:hypothetical protein BBF93_00595 [Hyphomonas sp. CACIAM 19H1]|uniref:DUF4159 domain-containing protein n=1 Tax=Hyphomonas sp. CACIAM 19H1 TaxID=1873716 RepID=UPI000DEE1885|nr:DUF4159 domain-containing protein [Hyphomonas sp. CACIAM 19H1]AXE62869.1 hypothetical protein BBF93_00595 [Hyphomonas sp. CACIAM 19H1]
MTAIGPFLLGAPLALFALLALPLIWWVLRATPPAPKEAELPSLRLLEGAEPEEETPARTPWWVWLIRTLAVIAAILGLSQPVWAPGARTTEAGGGPLLIVIDNGWASAPRWGELTNAASATLDAGDRDGAVHLLLTAPRQLNADPAERLSRADMARRLSSLDPQPWATDRGDALARLDASNLTPARIFYASDGLETEGGAAFAAALAARAPLTVFAAPPEGPAVITGLSAQTDAVTVRLARADARGSARAFVSALTQDGSALASAEAVFAEGAREAEAQFSIPAAALARIARFNVTGRAGAGTVWLWDSAKRTRRVGIVDTGTAAQPLLSDMHYIRKALEPFASISTGDIETLVAAAPDAIILSDVGQIPRADTERLTEWVENGGALIRFAGPRLAAQGDDLLPVTLRRSSRAIGGALAWEEPQGLAPFPDTSPFAGLPVPGDVRVRQQVLARPEPDLARKTWARLTDGSPLVSADSRGDGTLILFHITAGPDWGDLAYSGVFEQMLRRAIAAGRGEAVEDGDGTYMPQLSLDGFGRLTRASPNAAPVRASEFATMKPSEIHPPGLYQGPSGSRALNIGAGAAPHLMTQWPASARLLGDAEARSLRLAGPMLAIAAGLLALDLFIALFVAGRLRGLTRRGKAAAKKTGGAVGALILAFAFLPQEPAHAQGGYELLPDGSYRAIPSPSTRVVPLPAGKASEKEIEAALVMRFGYVETGDRTLNERTRAGLRGLSNILNMRTSVEPAEPHALNLETDALELYPLIFFVVPENAAPLTDRAVARLNAYLRAGGALVIDTRVGGDPAAQTDVSRLETLLAGLDAPQLQTVPDNHVLSRSFYLIKDYPGRFAGRRLWIEKTSEPGATRGDGVSRLFIGDADWVSAWAVDENGRDLYSVDGGPQQRETARRFGVNLVMYVLTGSYKDDQVHIPALLERLGEQNETPEPLLPGGNLLDGGPR